MKPLILDTILPKVYANADAKQNEYVELSSLLLDERIPEVIKRLKAGDKQGSEILLAQMSDELHRQEGLRLAWVQVVSMWITADNEDYAATIDNGIEVLRTLISTADHKNIEFLSLAAGTIYMLAFAHYKLGESKKAEKELYKAQKLYERLARKDNERFTPALMAAVEASTEVFKSKLKKMNVLAHYQVATELYQGKVSAGVTDAIGSLVDSITAEGDIHLKMGNYRDAVKFYTKALRYQKRISASLGMKELRISINLGRALLQLTNRRASGEQLLHSILPLAEKMGATNEIEEINSLLKNPNKSTFDITAFWKKLFTSVLLIVVSATAATAQVMIGHRGSVWGVENTATAFINGVKYAGYDGLECDIRTDADGTFIVNHDESFARIGGSHTPLAQRPTAGILNDRLLQTRDGITYEASAITLGQFLDLCNELDCIPVVEIKECWNIYSNDETGNSCYDGIPSLIDLIRHKGLEDKVVIISFMAGVIDHLRSNYPAINLQYLTDGEWRNVVDFCKRLKVDIDIAHRHADAELVETFHAIGLKVNTWTVDDLVEFKRLQEIGVDMITTNKIIK